MEFKNDWANALKYAVIYGVLSILTEIFLIAVVGLDLKITSERNIVALIILIFPTLLAIYLSGYKDKKQFTSIFILTAIITALASVALGDTEGLIKPIFIRPSSGFVAAALTTKLLFKNK